MNDGFDQVIDVTRRLAEALPSLVSDWTHARLYLVTGQRQRRHEACTRDAHGTRGGLPAGTLRRVRDYIEAQLATPIAIGDLASLAGLSRCHFSRAFKQSVGIPPHRYVMNRRVERAAQLIQRTDRPLSQIALDVGFSDQSHFSRVMARATGFTPLRLRRNSPEATDEEPAPSL
jgi:AraC-like DNA-binding protein